MIQSYKGFTLVELVIAITILGILGTVTLIYFKSYLGQARNTVRMDANMKMSVFASNYSISGRDLLVLTGTGYEVTGGTIGGDTASGAYYRAGIPNHNILSLEQDDFRDPITNDIYPLGVASYAGGIYQAAYTVEGDSGNVAKTQGNFSPRSPRTINGSGDSGDTTFILSTPIDVGFLRLYDRVTGTGVPADTSITSISKDGQTITLDTPLTANISSISFSEQEMEGLIGSAADRSIPVVNNNIFYPYDITR